MRQLVIVPVHIQRQTEKIEAGVEFRAEWECSCRPIAGHALVHSVSFSIKQQLADISDAATLRRLHRLAVQAETIDAFTNGL
jgi:uncharacterized protein YfcZ (UPF0381/DUF406 family)